MRVNHKTLIQTQEDVGGNHLPSKVAIFNVGPQSAHSATENLTRTNDIAFAVSMWTGE